MRLCAAVCVSPSPYRGTGTCADVKKPIPTSSFQGEEDRKRQERWMLFAFFSVALSEVRRRVDGNSEPSHKHNLWTFSSLTTHQTNFKLQLLQLHHIHSFARELAEVLSFFKTRPDKPPPSSAMNQREKWPLGCRSYIYVWRRNLVHHSRSTRCGGGVDANPGKEMAGKAGGGARKLTVHRSLVCILFTPL